MFLICHFCCKTYRLATKRTAKNRPTSRRKREREFLARLALFLALRHVVNDFVDCAVQLSFANMIVSFCNVALSNTSHVEDVGWRVVGHCVWMTWLRYYRLHFTDVQHQLINSQLTVVRHNKSLFLLQELSWNRRHNLNPGYRWNFVDNCHTVGYNNRPTSLSLKNSPLTILSCSFSNISISSQLENIFLFKHLRLFTARCYAERGNTTV